MAAQRIQRRRAKGWRMPATAVYVGRGSRWGNPFVVGTDGTREQCMTLYVALVRGYLCISKEREHIDQQKATLQALKRVTDLRGLDLACWFRTATPTCCSRSRIVVRSRNAS